MLRSCNRTSGSGASRLSILIRVVFPLVAAAVPLFRKQGYEEVTTRQIAVAAGVSTGALFNCFKDKAALFEAAMGEPPPDLRAFLTKLAASDSPFAAEAEHLRRHLLGGHA